MERSIQIQKVKQHLNNNFWVLNQYFTKSSALRCWGPPPNNRILTCIIHLFTDSVLFDSDTQGDLGFPKYNADKKTFQNTDLSILKFLWYFEFPFTIFDKIILTTLNNASPYCCSSIAKSLLEWLHVKQIILFFWMFLLKSIRMSGKGFP